MTDTEQIGQMMYDEELAVNMSCDACGYQYQTVYRFDRCELRGRRIA